MSVSERPEKLEAAFVTALHAAVEERGADYVYPDAWKIHSTCRYVRPDEKGPGCLVGLALHKVGWTLDNLRLREGTSAYNVLRAAGYSSSFSDAVAAAQFCQDFGGTWGDALVKFTHNLPVAESGANRLKVTG